MEGLIPGMLLLEISKPQNGDIYWKSQTYKT